MIILNIYYRMSNTDIITEADIASYHAGSKPIDFFVGKMKAYGGTDPQPTQPSANPTLIILGGSPGVGKSTAIKKITSYNGIPEDNYLVISLDNIVENYEPYREATRKVARDAGLNFTRKNANRSNNNFKKLNTIISKLSGAYLTYGDPRRKDPLTNMSKIRDAIFKRAIEIGYNIVYDTTFKTTKDIIKEDIFSHLTDLYSDIKVIHVYADDKTIQGRLNSRHRDFLMTKNYVRGVPKFLAQKFLCDNEIGFKKALDTYGSDVRFQFCDFHNIGNGPFECKPHTPKSWFDKCDARAKNERPVTPPSSTAAPKAPSSPGKRNREQQENLSSGMKSLSLSKTRKNRLIKKLEESLNNKTKTGTK